MRAPGALTAARVTLRPAARNDLPQIQPWYAEAVATAHGLREAPPDGTLEQRFSDTEAPDAGLLLIAKADDPAPIGLLQYRPGFPDKGWLAIDFLALAAGRRGWGYGSEAVRLVEDWAVDSRKAKRFLAEVDARNGLALYFWLRLGYRPLRPDEVFWRAPDEDGIIAMVRDGM